MLTSPVYSNTLSEQQRHLETTKTRKFLKRAQVDSVSLLVQRDNASFSSKMTDNLSKISRVSEFDRDASFPLISEASPQAAIAGYNISNVAALHPYIPCRGRPLCQRPHH
jgi:hypothetical protein